jgi:hypothetical protein
VNKNLKSETGTRDNVFLTAEQNPLVLESLCLSHLSKMPKLINKLRKASLVSYV